MHKQMSVYSNNVPRADFNLEIPAVSNVEMNGSALKCFNLNTIGSEMLTDLFHHETRNILKKDNASIFASGFCLIDLGFKTIVGPTNN